MYIHACSMAVVHHSSFLLLAPPPADDTSIVLIPQPIHSPAVEVVSEGLDLGHDMKLLSGGEGPDVGIMKKTA